MAIFIGLSDDEKLTTVLNYRINHDVEHVIHFRGFGSLNIPDSEVIEYEKLTEFFNFHRLINEISKTTLLVIDECLISQSSNTTTYNTLRHYLRQTDHQLIFNYVPQINTADDFMILFDFDTKSKWVYRKFDIDLIHSNSQVYCKSVIPEFEFIKLPYDKLISQRYNIMRDKLFKSIDLKDPHTIPRSLYIVGNIDKMEYIKKFKRDELYVSRLKRPYKNVKSYLYLEPLTTYHIAEFQHRFIDTVKFFQHTKQSTCKVLVSDLKVDYWYMNRYSEWRGRIEETCTSLRQQ